MSELREFLMVHPEDAADIRQVVEWVEDCHSKGDPVCAAAGRLLAKLAPKKPVCGETAFDQGFSRGWDYAMEVVLSGASAGAVGPGDKS